MTAAPAEIAAEAVRVAERLAPLVQPAHKPASMTLYPEGSETDDGALIVCCTACNWTADSAVEYTTDVEPTFYDEHPDLSIKVSKRDVEALLADRERLRRLVAAAHNLRDHRDEEFRIVRWTCSCGKWRASGPDATKFYPLPYLDEPQARIELAAHVAAVLDGVSE